jgi:hypothetical protein
MDYQALTVIPTSGLILMGFQRKIRQWVMLSEIYRLHDYSLSGSGGKTLSSVQLLPNEFNLSTIKRQSLKAGLLEPFS